MESVAEKIAALIDANGEHPVDHQNLSVREILRDYALDITRKGFSEAAPVRYLFIDGSSIVLGPAGWKVNPRQN